MANTTSVISTTSSEPQILMDEKWRLSKKEGLSRSRSCTSTSSTSASLMRNSSTATKTTTTTPLKRCAFTRKCASLVKEQRARFYIMRRCVTMLVCWRDYGDA
ncbi:hypothetical protein GIB67_040532 [Kingdonia uniflora]|uniref:Uncharacterized protein n=1 Tax=Kingdonia uniflora TaxID=39325 RepID=A0A7J7L5I5_9MAGN|nr:hypothetical protein GIB67_040532 [Kingdonia uniflora]